MNDSISVVLFGLTAALAWGVSDFFCAKSARSIGPILASTLVNIVGSIGFVVLILLSFHPQFQLTWANFLYAAGSGVLFSAGLTVFFLGLTRGSVSIVVPLSSTYPLTTTILALLLFNASLTATQMLGIALVVLGVVAISGLLNPKFGERKLNKGTSYGLIAAVCWGSGLALMAQAIKLSSWQTASIIESGFIIITLLILTPFIKGDEVISRLSLKQGLKNKFTVPAIVFQELGAIALIIGLSKSTTSGGAVVSAISACYPILTIFLALKHFNEKLQLIPMAGALLGITGIVILALV